MTTSQPVNVSHSQANAGNHLILNGPERTTKNADANGLFQNCPLFVIRIDI